MKIIKNELIYSNLFSNLLWLLCPSLSFCWFTFSPFPQGEVYPTVPVLSTALYESVYESQLWTIFDANKQAVYSGDAFPDRYKTTLTKGDYVLRLQVWFTMTRGHAFHWRYLYTACDAENLADSCVYQSELYCWRRLCLFSLPDHHADSYAKQLLWLYILCSALCWS